MKFQDILPDRRKFYLTRLDTFREDWTILSSKGNSLVSAKIEVPHWTVCQTLSCHCKDANVQINTYNHNEPINVFYHKGCGGVTLGLVTGRFSHFPVRPESFRPRVVSPSITWVISPSYPESFRPLLDVSFRPLFKLIFYWGCCVKCIVFVSFNEDFLYFFNKWYM